MRKNEILALEGRVIPMGTLEDIECSEDVSSVERVGMSGIDPRWHWWDVTFVDGDSIDIYTHTDQWGEDILD